MIFFLQKGKLLKEDNTKYETDTESTRTRKKTHDNIRQHPDYKKAFKNNR